MSNLGPQFDPATEARHIKNNKTRLTKDIKSSLGDMYAPQRSYISRGKGGKVRLRTSGVVYTPIDSVNTLIHYHLGSGRTSPELVKQHTERIFGALKDAGYNVSMSGDKIHVRH